MQGQLFTQDFLLRGIHSTPPWQALDDAAFERFRAALADIFSTLHAHSALNEAQTEQVVIERVLHELGWGDAFLRQVNLSDKGREDVPDLLLFPRRRSAACRARPRRRRRRPRRAPFVWDDDDRRARLAALDALFMHLYGLDADDAAYILDTFPIVRQHDVAAFGRYRTKDDVLAQMARIAEGTLRVDGEARMHDGEGQR